MENQRNLREIALELLIDIDKGNKFSNEAIHTVLKKYQYISKTERAFFTRLCEGTIEYRIQIDYIINQFSKTPVQKCKPLIRNLLRMSVYQLRYMDSVPDTATCNEAVKLAKKRGFASLSGFVNGVLRSVARGMDSIVWPDKETSSIQYYSVRYSMPEWIVEELTTYYSLDIVEKLLQSTLEEKPTTIRCIESRTSKEELVIALEQEEITVEPGYYAENALRIANYNYMQRVKPFIDGLFVVQDESSILEGYIANAQKGDTVLDVCAAPGGKTLHIADQMQGTGIVIARDLTDSKVDRIEENVERTHLINIKTQVWDACVYDDKYLEKAGIVIADLPCSGLGIMGKKNDIKYHISKEQMQELVVLQRRILSVVWQYVKPGGALIYSTCTLNPEENIENVKWFCENYPFVLDNIRPYIPEQIKEDTLEAGYLTLVPGSYHCDGFFMARMVRK